MFNFMKVIQNARISLSETINSQENNKLQSINCEDYIFPLEYLMHIPERMKTHKFFQDIEIGDIVIASVTRIYDNYLELVLICTMGALVRDIHSLKIHAICKSSELPILSNFSTTKAFRSGDNIKAIIIKVIRNESLEISMNENSQMNQFRQTDLGLISDENLPLHFKTCRCTTNSEKYFTEIFPIMKDETYFDIQKKLESFDINLDRLTLLDDIKKIHISEKETAKAMRKDALIKESMNCVIKGLNHYKLKQNNEAFDCYNRALLISENNIPALVARGALYASLKEYQLSIEDLERALKIDPSHKKAALYLSQTVAAYSKSMPESERVKAEILVKNAILFRNEPLSKEIINDDNKKNHVIVITDDSSSESIKNKVITKHKSKHKKKRKKEISKSLTQKSSSNESYHEEQFVISISSSNYSDIDENNRFSSDRRKSKQRLGKSRCNCKYSRSLSRSSGFMKRKSNDSYVNTRCHKKSRSRSVSFGFADGGPKYDGSIIHCRKKFRSRSMSFVFEKRKHNPSVNDCGSYNCSSCLSASSQFVNRKRKHSYNRDKHRSADRRKRRRSSNNNEDISSRRRSRRHYSSSYESISGYRTMRSRRRSSFSRSRSRYDVYSREKSEYDANTYRRSRSYSSVIWTREPRSAEVMNSLSGRSRRTSRMMSLLSRSSISTYNENVNFKRYNDWRYDDSESRLLSMDSQYSTVDYQDRPRAFQRVSESDQFNRSEYRPERHLRRYSGYRRGGRGRNYARRVSEFKSYGHSRNYSPNSNDPESSLGKRWSGLEKSKSSSRYASRLPEKVSIHDTSINSSNKFKKTHQAAVLEDKNKCPVIETNESMAAFLSYVSEDDSEEMSKRNASSKEIADFISSMRYNIPL